jgi:hypothetical protein
MYLCNSTLIPGELQPTLEYMNFSGIYYSAGLLFRIDAVTVRLQMNVFA